MSSEAGKKPVGRDYHTEEHAVGFYNAGDRVRHWGKLGAFWGGIFGLFLAPAFFWIPGVGPILTGGLIGSALMGTIEGVAAGVALGAGTSALAAALASVRYPSRGGTVVFLDRAFGVDLVTGSLNSLLWLSYMVMVALYAFAFGSYGATFFSEAHHDLARQALTAAAILVPTAINTLDARVVGRAETYVVALKLAILAVFVGVGLFGVRPSALAPAQWSPATSLAAGGMIIFVAYEGFELIANSAEDVANPQATLPRAFYGSVGFVVALYVLIAAVAVGTLPVDEIVSAKDYALAAAAEPFLGHAGFVLISVAALLSTFSAINATLYGASRLAYSIAKEGELPEELERTVRNEPVDGLVITAGAALLLALVGDLESISTMGSAGFLIVFFAVNAANARLHAETKSRAWVSGLGALACLGALVALVGQTLEAHPSQLWVLAALLGLAVLIEGTYRALSRRASPARPRFRLPER